VCDQRDRRRGAQNEPYGQKQDRPEVGAQLERRGEEGCRAQERRQEDEEDHLGGDLDLGQPWYEADAEPPKNQENRVRNVQHPGQLREQCCDS
jgi:hypothetical protein